ncbi:MAG: hypothetical protein HC844_10815 [Tabrizicola sp.]|nr:hypothetical protein [Tabrizicola sp.]
MEIATGKAQERLSPTANETRTAIDADDVTARDGVISVNGGKRFCLQKDSLIFLFTPQSSPI